MAIVSQRNKFSKGEELDVLEPKSDPFNIKIEKMYDEWHNEIDSAPHATQKIFIPTGRKIKKGAYLRRRRKWSFKTE